jgi:hypothetical protein
MPIIAAALQLAVNAFCIYHIWKSGRPYWWMFIVVGFPVLGALAYLLLEVLPSSGAQQQVRRIVKNFTPDADFRARLLEAERCGSLANKLALADECVNLSQFDDAIRMYQSVMQGRYEGDTAAQFGLASAYFWKGEAALAIEGLQKVIDQDPMYGQGQAKLMLARAYVGAGQPQTAREHYEALLPHFAGEEARAWYISFLCQQGAKESAQALMGQMDKRFRTATPAYRRDNKLWRGEAQKALAG